MGPTVEVLHLRTSQHLRGNPGKLSFISGAPGISTEQTTGSRPLNSTHKYNISIHAHTCMLQVI